MPSPIEPNTSIQAVLVADLGCTFCQGLANSVQLISKGHVALQDFSDPDLPEAVLAMLRSKVEPLLYASPGHNQVKVWRGAALRLHLARLLGPIASGQLLAKIGTAITARQSALTIEDQSQPRLNRRQLLGAGGSLALGAAAIGLFPAGAAGATPLSSSEPATSDPRSLLTASPLWSQAQALAAGDGLVHDPDLDTTTLHAGRYAAIHSLWKPTTAADRSMATIGLIDLTRRAVPYLRSAQVFATLKGGTIRVSDHSGSLFDINVTADATGQGLTVRSAKHDTLFKASVDGSGTVQPDRGFESTWNSLNASVSAPTGPQPDLFGLSFCDFAVGILCGAGTGGGCAALGIALGITTLGAGIAAGAVCAIIAFFGCAEATCIICRC